MSTAVEPTDGAATAAPSVGSPSRWRRRLLVGAIVFVVVVSLLRALLLETFYVPSDSMEPGLRPGDRLVVTKWSTDVHRGDVIVFDGTRAFGGDRTSPAKGIAKVVRSIGESIGIRPGEADYVKRVIGIGGDKVAVGRDGKLRVNGKLVTENYLPKGMSASDEPFSVTVPKSHLFVLGDNRVRSNDSRDHLGDPGGGMIADDEVIGIVAWRYWPLSRMGDAG